MAGLANTIFPHGTFWMRKFAHVLCDHSGTEPTVDNQNAADLSAAT